MAQNIHRPFPLEQTITVSSPYLNVIQRKDLFPAGNDQLGVAPVWLKNHTPGHDFPSREAFRLYQGTEVPGFPRQPHRGFEIVTLVLEGYVDHADSLGGAGRAGPGDVLWLNCGRGLQHSEMYPLLDDKKPNPFEILQIWLNLPAVWKRGEPVCRLIEAAQIPVLETKGAAGAGAVTRLITGQWAGQSKLPPVAHSWAADPARRVRILLIDLEPGGTFELESISPTLSRQIHLVDGTQLQVLASPAEQTQLSGRSGVHLAGDGTFQIRNTGTDQARVLLLEGEPILEPLVQYGPFILNTQDEISLAFQEFRQTGFGGWPWSRPDPVHGREARSFFKAPGSG